MEDTKKKPMLHQFNYPHLSYNTTRCLMVQERKWGITFRFVGNFYFGNFGVKKLTEPGLCLIRILIINSNHEKTLK